jgi:hypothetical protein
MERALAELHAPALLARRGGAEHTSRMNPTPSSTVRFAALAVVAAAIGVSAALVVAGRGEPPAAATRDAAAPDSVEPDAHVAAAGLAPTAVRAENAAIVADAAATPEGAAPKKAERKRREGGARTDEPPQAFLPLPVDPETAEARAKERAVAVGYAAADRTARELSLSFDDAARLRDVMARIEARRVSIASKLNYPDPDPEAIAAEMKEFGVWAKQEIANEFGDELGRKIAKHSRMPHVGYDETGAPHEATPGEDRKSQRVSKQKKSAKQKTQKRDE